MSRLASQRLRASSASSSVSLSSSLSRSSARAFTCSLAAARSACDASSNACSNAPSNSRCRARRGSVRVSLALQVALLALLAAVVAALVSEAARFPFLRARVDVSQRRVNTLSEPTLERIRQLPKPVQVDVFFRPEPGPLRALVAEVQELGLDLLLVASAQSDAKLELVVHDTGDLEAVQVRARELGQVDVANKVVLSLGERRAVLGFDDWADLQVDPTDPRRAVLARFKGEEALGSALARLSAMERPRIAFSSQRGELDQDSAEAGGASRLAQALRDDGFELVTWDGSGPLPEHTDIVALLGPVQPFGAAQLAALRAHVERGGRLFACAPSSLFYDGKGSVSDLLGPFGVSVLRGFVCKEVLDPVTGRPAEGDERVAVLQIAGSLLSSQHPITAPFVRHARRIVFPLALALQRGQPPLGTSMIDLAKSPESSWRELADPATPNQLDFAYDGSREEAGSFALLSALEVQVASSSVGAGTSTSTSTSTGSPATSGADASAQRGRIVALACPNALCNEVFEINRDLWLASFNWLARRDFRVVVASRDPLEGRLDLERGAYLQRIVQVGWYALPLACLLLGLSIWLARRRA